MYLEPTSARVPTLQALSAKAGLCWLTQCVRRGHANKGRRGYWRCHMRNLLSPQLRELLLDMALPDGRLCDTVQYVLVDILLCPRIAKLELKYVRTWYQEPLAKMLLSWRGCGIRRLVLEDVAWLGGTNGGSNSCCTPDAYKKGRSKSAHRCRQCASAGAGSKPKRKKKADHWATSDRAVLVFDTPPPPCASRLLHFIVSAMPALNHVHLKYVCDDETLSALGRYCQHLSSLDCAWSPRVTDRGVGMLILASSPPGNSRGTFPSIASQSDLSLSTSSSTSSSSSTMIFPRKKTPATDGNQKKKKPRLLFADRNNRAWNNVTAALAYRLSDVFVPIFATSQHPSPARGGVRWSPTTAGAAVSDGGDGWTEYLARVVRSVERLRSLAADGISAGGGSSLDDDDDDDGVVSEGSSYSNSLPARCDVPATNACVAGGALRSLRITGTATTNASATFLSAVAPNILVLH